MLNNLAVASDLGYLQRKSQFLGVKQLQSAKDEDVLVLCTGAQGEPFSALTRIARGDHPMVSAQAGDTVVISANPIPGNEEAVHRIINQLYKKGARVFSGARHHVHASGHAARDELKRLLELVKPRYFVPVHGEYRHLAIHAELARTVGIAAANVHPIDNGTILEVDRRGLRVVKDRASTEYVYVDGWSVDESGEEMLRDRVEMANDGVVIISIVVDRTSGERLNEPELITRGVASDPDTERLLDDARDHVRKKLAGEFDGLPWDAVEAKLHRDVARYIAKRSYRHPLILPLVTKI